MASFRQPSPSLRERLAAGKAQRAAAPRSSHSAWSPPANRADPLAVLRKGDARRIPELVPIRYGRMLSSPFAFLRGAAAIMAGDLATMPVSGLRVQAAGDAHLANFGIYATPERNRVFDVNDFDETLPGPWEWDVKRLATSIVVAGRTGGLTPGACAYAAAAALKSYREQMRGYAQMGYLAVSYAQIDERAVLRFLEHSAQREVERTFAQAARQSTAHELEKLTTLVDGKPRLKESPPLMMHETDARASERMYTMLEGYLTSLRPDRQELLRQYSVVDVARKVVGVGSVGTRCFVILMLGASDADPLLLQVKEADTSVLEPYAGPSVYPNHGQRVIMGQQVTQASPDVFLGWGVSSGSHYYVRQLHDMKVTYRLEGLSPAALEDYADLCGWALARAHARSGDPARITGYLGRSDIFDRAVVAFANAYADQTEADHAALVAAVKAGKINAETGA
ncbi:MAG TPA: DUF2252 domain-containing protein [Ktedonobacterales bacterium]